MAYKATTEFCWCGVRYAAGEVVSVPAKQAAPLLRNRLIHEVPDAAVAQDAAAAAPQPAELGEDQAPAGPEDAAEDQTDPGQPDGKATKGKDKKRK